MNLWFFLPFKSNIECPTLSLFPKSHYEIRFSTLCLFLFHFFFCYAQYFVFYVHVINSTTFQFIPFPFLKNSIIPLRRHLNVQNKKTARDPYSSKTSNPSIKQKREKIYIRNVVLKILKIKIVKSMCGCVVCMFLFVYINSIGTFVLFFL